MQDPLQGIVSVLGRVLLSLIFLMAAVGNKIPQFNEVTQVMAKEGIPMPQMMLVGAIVFLLAGSLSVILGFQARIGAALLLVFLCLASYYFHDFWTMQGEEAQQQTIQFMKNLALIGAMLFLIANGSGAGSLDGRLRAQRAIAA